jgi:protein-disulfide isomerase
MGAMTPQRLTIVTLAIAVLAVVALLVVPQLTSSAPQASADVEFATQPRIGASDAPVTVAVFEDWLCPSCAQFEANVMPTIKREYVDTGQVQLVFVDFLVIQGSDQVARLGQCVHQQSNEAFWEMKAPLYRAQAELRDPRRARDLALTYAPGIDADQLDRCLADPANLEPARQDTRLAQSLSLTGTPSVLVNGTAVSPTLAEVRRAIDAALP